MDEKCGQVVNNHQEIYFAGLQPSAEKPTNHHIFETTDFYPPVRPLCRGDIFVMDNKTDKTLQSWL